jgi:putative nucleotidyltransferase with HDIG domain
MNAHTKIQTLAFAPLSHEQQASTHPHATIAMLDWKEFHHKVSALSYCTNLKDLYRESLNLLILATAAEAATYFSYEPDTDELVVAALAGENTGGHLLGLHVPGQEILAGTSRPEDQPIMAGDLVSDPGWLRIAHPVFASRLTNLLSMPLTIQDRLIGVIQVYNYVFANLDHLEILQERIAIEIDRKTELLAIQNSNQRLRGLVDALGQLGGTLDRKQILEMIVEHSTTLVQAERASLYINNPGNQENSYHIAFQSAAPTTPKAAVAQPTRPGTNPLTGNSSVVTIPLRAGSEAAGQQSNARQLGGLMVVKPSNTSFTKEDTSLLKTLLQQAGTLLQAAEIFEGMEELFFDVIEAMVASIDAKDTYTQGHSKRVSDYSVLIAQELGLDANQIYNIRIGSLLHDVGKIGIPDHILKKEGKLTPSEYSVIQGHPLTGWKILRQVRLLEAMLPAIIEHHEKLNGSGYPYGLRGEQISLMGRIVAVADVFDAMSSHRPYRDAIPVLEVMNYLEENAGTLFDTRCVAALKQVINRSIGHDL